MELKLLINHYWTPCMSHRDNHGDWLFLLNSFIYCMKTFRLFLNIIRKILGKLPSEGGTKKWFFQIQFVKHLKWKLNSEDEPCISKIEWVTVAGLTKSHFLKWLYLIEIFRYGSRFLDVIITFIGFKITFSNMESDGDPTFIS